MIRDLRPSDIPRQLLPGRLAGSDLAFTRASIARPKHSFNLLELSRWSFPPTTAQHAFASVRKTDLNGVAVVRPRNGRRAWELAHLVCADGTMDDASDLLEYCAGWVSEQGCERLFLRVPHGHPIARAARRAGFMPAYAEDVHGLQRAWPPAAGEPTLHLRLATAADAHGIFRLYNSVVPASIRPLTGLTLEQWQDANEAPGGSVAEYVSEDVGRLRAWLRIAKKGQALTLDAVAHHDTAPLAAGLVADASRLAGGRLQPQWVVPTHQDAIGRVLRDQGWTPRQSYSVFVRMVAKPIKEPALVPVQA
ncbi:MAG: hypothetical protein FJ318_06770 [SAR202 cluster bacterium]|nr:hypothetical protein [SAR202 cluster bacterium]